MIKNNTILTKNQDNSILNFIKSLHTEVEGKFASVKVQKTSWGEIEWLQVDDASLSQRSMNVGIATVSPHVAQKSHIHHESEQFIYIIEGSGVNVVDGHAQEFKAGEFFYMQPNVTHQIVNTSSAPVRHLLVTVYSPRRHAPANDLPEIENFSGCLHAAAEAIRRRIDSPNSPPVAIFDDMGNLVLQTGIYPTFCLDRCAPQQKPEHCPCFRGRTNPHSMARTSTRFICPNGVTVIRAPVMYKKNLLGSIFSGHMYLGSREAEHGEIDMYDTPEGTIAAVQRWTDNITESIVHFCSFNALRNSLSIKESMIEHNRKRQRVLDDSLKDMQHAVINMRINRHFLFNTLNAIAGLSFASDSDVMYQAITDLAKMFRYTTSEKLKIVQLREEIEYLRTYLHMQQLRYGTRLNAEISCDGEVLDGLVPFNFLQPFVENAFTHGFSDMAGEKILSLQIVRKDGRLVFVVFNNGAEVDIVTIRRVLDAMGNDSGHGLSLTYAKLRAIYGDDFSIDMTSGCDGTKIMVSVPFMTYEASAEEGYDTRCYR